MGEVEADETWIGGKDKNRHWNKRSHAQGGYLSNKTMVIGAISRKGNVVCQVIEERAFARWISLSARSFRTKCRSSRPMRIRLQASDEGRASA